MRTEWKFLRTDGTRAIEVSVAETPVVELSASGEAAARFGPATARTLILVACHALEQRGTVTERYGAGLFGPDADYRVLLHDATRWFCGSVSEQYGEPASQRWTPELPDLFLAHPERCEEWLRRLEREDFEGLTELLPEVNSAP